MKMNSRSPEKKSYSRVFFALCVTFLFLSIGLYLGKRVRVKNRLVLDDTETNRIVFYDWVNIDFTGKRIVDVGCGEGGLVKWFIEKRKHLEHGEVFGIDLLEVIEKTKKRRHKYAKQYKEGVGEDIPFEDLSVDVLIFRHSFHHVEDHEKTRNEIIRVLKPGGRVIFIEPVNLKGRYEAYEIAKYLFRNEEEEQKEAHENIKEASPKDGIFLLFEKVFAEHVTLEEMKHMSRLTEPDVYAIGKWNAKKHATRIAREDDVNIKDLKFFFTMRLSVWERK